PARRVSRPRAGRDRGSARPAWAVRARACCPGPGFPADPRCRRPPPPTRPGLPAEAARSSKARQVGMGQLAAAHMDTPQFGAAMQHRKDLAGVEQALGIEGAFQTLLLIEID